MTIVQMMRKMEITNWKTIKDFLSALLPDEKENPALRILISLRFDRIRAG